MGLWIAIVLVGLLFLYSILPNVISRLFLMGVMRKTTKRTDNTSKLEVALTFDDGPDPLYTPRILDVLRDLDVKATFFIIAQKAMKSPDLIHRMIDEGHAVQIHGYTHSFVPLLAPVSALLNVRRTQALLRERFAIHAAYYRPTWGLMNAAVWLDALRRDYRLITWSIMVGDWNVTTPDILKERIVTRMHPGAIIVLHDSDDTWGAEKTAPEAVIKMLPHLAHELRGMGYDFKVLS